SPQLAGAHRLEPERFAPHLRRVQLEVRAPLTAPAGTPMAALLGAAGSAFGRAVGQPIGKKRGDLYIVLLAASGTAPADEVWSASPLERDGFELFVPRRGNRGSTWTDGGSTWLLGRRTEGNEGTQCRRLTSWVGASTSTRLASGV